MNRTECVFSAVLDNPRYKTSQKKRQYLIWGTGKFGEVFAKFMERMNVLPVAFVDSDEEKHI